MDEKQRRELKRLQAMLAEDAKTPEEADTLLAAVTRLRQWSAPEASPQATAALIDKLLPELPRPARSPFQRVSEWWPVLLVRAQARVVQGELLAASALVLALGVLVTLAGYRSSAALETLPLVLIAPVVAAVGIAFLYGPEAEQMLELESTTPTSSRLVLLARLALVFGFNLVLCLVSSIVLALLHAQISLWPLVLAWLAPMAFLSALAFFLSIATADPLNGIAISLLVWILQQISAHRWFADSIGSFLPNLLDTSARPWLLLLALALVAAALWLVGHEGRLGNQRH